MEMLSRAGMDALGLSGQEWSRPLWDGPQGRPRAWLATVTSGPW